ncbi:hypothetical protein VTO42DRAFT_7791 [Malbranchea cinnamomea]
MDRRHNGMDHGSMHTGNGVPSLFYLQQMYWAVVGAAIGVATLANILNKIVAAQRFTDTTATPSKPKSLPFRTYATVTAMTRELAHASIGPIAIGKFNYHPPPLGPVSIVLANLVVLMVLCFYKLNTLDQWSWESIGYRTGFISIAQLPLIILLAGKNNIIGILTGSSYERLNWLHRWISRTLWLTATIHLGFWFRSWDRFDYISVKLTTDPLTQRGFAAWCILTFMVITTMAPVRRLSYEVFVISHLLTLAGFLAAIWYHAPNEVKVWVWIPIGLIAFDRVCRFLFMTYTNLTIFHPNTRYSTRGIWANAATFTPLPGNVTKVTVPNPALSWNPGQHAFVSCHSILPFQSHPFSIVSIPSDGTLEFLVRAERGGTRKLFAYASKQNATLGNHTDVPAVTGTQKTKFVTIDGPYGRMRNLRQFDSVILISGGMGATFTMPLMRDIVEGWKNFESHNTNAKPWSLSRRRCLVKCIHFVWVIRAQSQLIWFTDKIQQLRQDFETCSRQIPGFDKQLEISIYITCDTELSPEPVTAVFIPKLQQNGVIQAQEAKETEITELKKPSDTATNGERLTPPVANCLPKGGCCCTVKVSDPSQPTSPCRCLCPTADAEITNLVSQRVPIQTNSLPPEKTPIYRSSQSSTAPPSDNRTLVFRVLSGRPDVRELIRTVLEKAEGESAVVGCGPRGLNADIRRSMVSLSDERAVHKGTGAQGIYLHIEQFAF